MTNLAGIFQQHADFTELLKTWVELTVTNHLRDKWLRVILPALSKSFVVLHRAKVRARPVGVGNVRAYYA